MSAENFTNTAKCNKRMTNQQVVSSTRPLASNKMHQIYLINWFINFVAITCQLHQECGEISNYSMNVIQVRSTETGVCQEFYEHCWLVISLVRPTNYWLNKILKTPTIAKVERSEHKAAEFNSFG